MDVLRHGPVGQSEHWQIDTLLEQVLKRDVLDVVTPLVDTFEVVDGATATDNIPSPSFA